MGTPDDGWLKCNVDAACWRDVGVVGFKMCVRDHAGRFIVARSNWVVPYLQSFEVEALGLLVAMQWVESMGFKELFLR